MARFTIHDVEKTVSFGADARLAQAFVAACTAEPALLEDVLPIVEPYAIGTTERVMMGLLEFDRIAGEAPGAPDEWDALDDLSAVEVIDPRTDRLARTPDDEGLVCIDLARQSISGYLAAPGMIAARGTLAPPITGGAQRRMAFVLSDRWTVDVDTVERDATSVEDADIDTADRDTVAAEENATHA